MNIVTHPSTNRAWHKLTLLIKSNALTTTPVHQPCSSSCSIIHAVLSVSRTLWKICDCRQPTTIGNLVSLEELRLEMNYLLSLPKV